MQNQGPQNVSAPQAQAMPQQNPAMPQQGQTFPNQAPQQGQAVSSAPNQPAQNQQQPPKQVKQNPNSTQGSLQFSELRDSMVIMKDGSFRAVIACKSINFDLMANNEREGVEMSYQDFLNSINFTVQILIRSQRIDIRPYIDKLENLRRNEDNMLLGRLMLSQEANIMDKSFFVVVPYYSSKEAEKELTETKNFVKAMSKNQGTTVSRINRDIYDKAITEINTRCDSVIQGLYSIGIHAVRLNTNELGQLFYSFNNPDDAIRQPLGDFNKLSGLYVKKATPEEIAEIRKAQGE